MRGKIVVRLVVAPTAAVAVLMLPCCSSSSPALLGGSRGHWTSAQKAIARQTLIAAPVLESGALAACVVDKIAAQIGYSQFQQYARMAAADDFDNPNQDQAFVVSNLMADALGCPASS